MHQAAFHEHGARGRDQEHHHPAQAHGPVVDGRRRVEHREVGRLVAGPRGYRRMYRDA